MSTEYLGAARYSVPPRLRDRARSVTAEHRRRLGASPTASGLTDAKLHNIPAVYVFALNSTLSVGMAPLQDVSEYGANIVPQLRAELGDGCVVIDGTSTFEDRMRHAQRVLEDSRPVAICFYPDILSRTVEVDVPRHERRTFVDPRDVDHFLSEFPKVANGK